MTNRNISRRLWGSPQRVYLVDMYCRQHSANDLKLLLEATWAITNLAAGPKKCVEAALPAAPMLVVLLQSSSSRQIAEQSAWALGQLLLVLHAKPACVTQCMSHVNLYQHHIALMFQQPPLICTPAGSHMQQTCLMSRPNV